MADTDDKTQVNVLLTHEAARLLDALHSAKKDEAKREGQHISLSYYVETLVREEAKRQGLKPKKGKP
jgi:hypothetical protein